MHVAYADTSRDFERHFHNTHELLFVVSGRVRLTIEHDVYDMQAGDAAFISNLEEHATAVLEEPYSRYFLTVSAQELERLVQNPTLASIFRLRPASFVHCVPCRAAAEQITTLFLRMIAAAQAERPYGAEYMGHCLSLLLTDIFWLHPQAFPGHEMTLSKMVYAAQRYLDLHFTEPLRIQTLADSLFVSASWLSHSFKREVGMSPRKYVQLMRLSAAQEMLLRERLSVLETAHRCGFPDASSFIRAFQQHYGMTPKQMQLRHR